MEDTLNRRLTKSTDAHVTGNGHDGQLVGKIKWVEGKKGRGLQIMDTSQYVQVEDANVLHFEDKDFTFIAWINIADFAPDNNPGILSKRVLEAGNGKPCLLWIVDKDTHALEIQMRDNKAPISILTAKTEIKKGEWYHAAVVKDKKNVTFYLNGKEDAKLAHGLLGSFTSDQPLYIGVHHYGNVWNCTLSGTIDEVGIFNKALTGAEIGSVMESISAVSFAGKLARVWGAIKAQ